ncbi:AAA family ATPase [Nocardia sp. NPDC020380]|uniref:AAA family ATPase n=1 Tax=Nocardia sp. NPDC020380 TaxID=3364309 RepID=UPI0037B9EA06
MHQREALYGREQEQIQLDRMLTAARCGNGSAAVLYGEPAVGKTTILGDALQRATDFRILRCRGAYAESELSFAALHELLLPVTGRLAALPDPQARALGAALGSDPGPADPFLVRAALVTLLTTLAAEMPLLLIVDDAHLVDDATAHALVFALRRLSAAPVVLLCAMRFDPAGTVWRGLPALPITGLDEADARRLVEEQCGPVGALRVARVLEVAQGNPLALRELPSMTAELAGATRGSMLFGPRLRAVYHDRVAGLPGPVRTLLTVAAAETRGVHRVVSVSAGALGVTTAAWEFVTREHLLSVGDGCVDVLDRLLCAAVHDAATPAERRAAHLAIAAALTAPGEQDLRVWHRAVAAEFPDEALAAALADSAEHARYGSLVAAAMLRQAAAITPEPDAAARRLAAAARFAWAGGDIESADSLLGRAADRISPEGLAVAGRGLAGLLEFVAGQPERAAALLHRDAALVSDPETAAHLRELAAQARWAAGLEDPPPPTPLTLGPDLAAIPVHTLRTGTPALVATPLAVALAAPTAVAETAAALSTSGLPVDTAAAVAVDETALPADTLAIAAASGGGGLPASPIPMGVPFAAAGMSAPVADSAVPIAVVETALPADTLATAAGARIAVPSTVVRGAGAAGEAPGVVIGGAGAAVLLPGAAAGGAGDRIVRSGTGTRVADPEGPGDMWQGMGAADAILRRLPPAPLVLLWGLAGQAIEPFGAAVAGLRAAGAHPATVCLLPQLAILQFANGRWAEAEETLAEAFELARSVGTANVLAQCYTLRAKIAALRGDSDTVLESAERALAIARPHRAHALIASVHWHLGFHALSKSDPEAAYLRLRTLAQPGHDARHPTYARLAALDMVEAASRVGRLEEAAAYAETIQAWAIRSRADWAISMAYACRALLSADDRADHWFQRALAPRRAAPELTTARIHLLYGKWLRRMRRRGDAAEHLRTARDSFERMGATEWALRAQQELELTGRRLAPAATPGAGSVLTAQETRVARLAAQGLTNREIGAELFLSPRTVGHHLSRIFGKLGLSRRAELVDIDFDNGMRIVRPR